ncbi:MAG: DUF5106 domain-containing protein [Tidjanibacter sp.]|nr:DUF5106 domain-containing protein [Tidjanibacter sp.]
MKRPLIITSLLVLAAALSLVGCVGTNRSSAELEQYWNGYDFASTDGLRDIVVAEKRFEGYAKLLNAVPDSIAAASVKRFIGNAASNEVALYVYMEWFETYFYSLNSPYRNDAVFESYLDALLLNEGLDDYAKLRPTHLKKLLAKNRVGLVAEDFALRDLEGNDFRLSDLLSRRVLLFFVDSECTSCRETMDQVARSRKIASSVRSGELQLLAVAAFGRRESVQNLATDYDRWRVAFCPSDDLASGDKYDMSLTPSFLLIGADGRVEITYDTDISIVEKLL